MMFLRTAPVVLAFAAVLFVAAGRLDVPAFWAYLALQWLCVAATFTALARRDPGLFAERVRPPSDRDRATRRLVAAPFLVHLVLAGLDARHGWTTVPLLAQLAGFAAVLAGYGMAAWTVLANPYASSAVRIQHERGQRVITHGPYAIVRHPMYLGVVLTCLGGGLALGSLWSALALLPVLAIFWRRTRIEDRMLHAELPGYAAYAARVRWRVVPGVY